MNRITTFLTALAAAAAVSGCGAPPIAKTPPEEVNKMQQMRVIFDKVNGDYSSVSAEDKATLAKLAGGQASVDSLWKVMSSNKKGGASMSAPNTPGR